MLEKLREVYLDMEGWMEDKVGNVKSDFQGGAIDVIAPAHGERGGKII
ncbi:MAG: hypothetical protein OCU17_02305 [Methanophagales archaeon]|nr:hypothetical protein [Methanophagales archaeon]